MGSGHCRVITGIISTCSTCTGRDIESRTCGPTPKRSPKLRHMCVRSRHPGLNVETMAKNAPRTHCADFLAAGRSSVCSNADHPGPDTTFLYENQWRYRDTPRGSVLAFLKALERGDYSQAPSIWISEARLRKLRNWRANSRSYWITASRGISSSSLDRRKAT